MTAFQAQAGKWVNKIFEGLAITGWLAIVLMMLWGVANVIGGWLRFTVPATVEWTEILNVIAITLPLTYVTSKKAHIVVDLVTQKLAARPKRVLYIIVLFLTLLFSSVLAWQLSIQAWNSTKIGEYVDVAAIDVYFWPGKLSLAIGFTGMAAVTLYQIIIELRTKNGATIQPASK